ncbi:hypothetical protein D3C72_948840 [compost metagenome]
MHDHVAAAADVAGARQGHRLGEGHGHGGVHGVTALLQDIHADLCRQRALAHDHAAPPDRRAVDLAIVDDVAAAADGRPGLDRRLLRHRRRGRQQTRRRNRQNLQMRTHGHPVTISSEQSRAPTPERP